MEVTENLCIPVSDPTQVGDARRQVARVAERLGMVEPDAGRVALVATELAGNLVKHSAGGGQLLVRVLAEDGVAGLELLALDQGPGMADVGRCLQDGYSTAGSPGTGLGAVSRMADLFQVVSTPGAGTALLARLWSPRGAAAAATLELGAVRVPKPGQQVCGDAWAAVRNADGMVVLVCDGLGHGTGAAEASHAAVRLFREHARLRPAEILERMHPALRATRGAAAAVARVERAAGSLRYAGVGNITGVLRVGEQSRSLISHNGIVGHEMRRVQEFTYPWGGGAVLVMHTDGVGTRWELDRYPGLASRHASLIAGVVHRDHHRGSDDATTVVVRDAA